MPPCDGSLRTWKRVSGTVASSMSSTLTPERLSPPISARLSARATRLVSRLVRDGGALRQRGAVGHREPDRDLGVDVDVGEAAHAAAAEQRARAAALPHDRRRDDRARLDRLERVHLHVRVDDRVLADEALVADHRALLDAHVRAQVGVAPDHAAAQVRAGARRTRGRGTTARSRNASAFTMTSVPSTVYGPDVRAGLDAAVVADHDRAVDPGLGADLDVAADPAAVAEPEAVDVDLHPAVEDVGVGADVGLERADVLPVAVGHVAVHACGPSSSSAGNTSPEKSTTSPSGMKSNTSGSST